ncbi:hypothetical protein [Mangrovibacterium sp.]|uniref:hypothetical protein n=1 Tax=Mangrovibacterium sp. TaxID=1961364 RepID=UPI003565AA85
MSENNQRNISFNTLLYVDLKNQSLSENGIGGKFEDQIKTFVGCALALARSLSFFTGYQLTVLTNNEPYLRQFSNELNYKELEFQMQVKPGIPFYSAHFKLDVFRYFASNEESDLYMVLVDSDVVCINPAPINFYRCVDDRMPLYFDITSHHIPAYGRERMIRDKELVLVNSRSNGMWVGGELVGGVNSFYRELVQEVDRYQTRYFEMSSKLFHQGDEFLLSVAIELMLKKGVAICEAGRFGIIGRYWTFPTKHIQKKWKSYSGHFLVHLPSDKRFLKSTRRVGDDFSLLLSRYIFRARIEGRLRYWILKLMRRI